MSKNKVDGKQTEQGYVSFGYKQLANCEELKKKKKSCWIWKKNTISTGPSPSCGFGEQQITRNDSPCWAQGCSPGVGAPEQLQGCWVNLWCGAAHEPQMYPGADFTQNHWKWLSLVQFDGLPPRKRRWSKQCDLHPGWLQRASSGALRGYWTGKPSLGLPEVSTITEDKAESTSLSLNTQICKHRVITTHTG